MSSSLAAPPTYRANVAYAARVLAGSLLVWLLLDLLGDRNPIWALISLLVVSDQELGTTVSNFKSRFLNTIIGAAIALALLWLVPAPLRQSWLVPVGMAASVLFCTSVFTVGNWKIAPVTVVLVLAAGIREGSGDEGMATAWKRTSEVLLGSLVAVAVAWAWVHLARRRRLASGR